jgi:hypothetical protein
MNFWVVLSVIDPEAQKLYVNQKQKPDEEKTLTIQEKSKRLGNQV